MMRRTREGISPFAARQDAVSSGDPPVHSPAVGDPDFSRPSETEQTRRPASFEGGSPGGNSGGATVGKASSTSSSTAAVTPGEASINLANCIMGAGALSLPAFFKSCGVVLGVLLLLASCAWTWASAVMMVKTADVVSLRVLKGAPVSSYEELMSLTLGTRGHILSTVGILLLQIGCLVGYANILADVVSPFAIDILPPGLEPQPSLHPYRGVFRCHVTNRNSGWRGRGVARPGGGEQGVHFNCGRLRGGDVVVRRAEKLGDGGDGECSR